MARRRLILIPPSEGKSLGGEGPPWRQVEGVERGPLHRQRLEVSAALARELRVRAAKGTLGGLFGVSGDALQRALDADESIDTAPTLRAIDRYDGVLYQHLDAASMTPGQQRRLDRTVRILSGLWGVVSPHEMIPDYRLKMSASLDGLGKLSRWWRPFVGDLLAVEARGAELWDLLPAEHSNAFVAPPRSTRNRVVFLSPGKGGELVPVSHWNKALKGSLVSHLVRNPSVGPADLLEWDHPAGYSLEPASLDLDPPGVGPVDSGARVRTLRFVAQT